MAGDNFKKGEAQRARRRTEQETACAKEKNGAVVEMRGPFFDLFSCIPSRCSQSLCRALLRSCPDRVTHGSCASGRVGEIVW